MNRMELSVCLTSGMEAKGWKITDLAEASELAYETVRSAVRGQTSPSLENASKMLAALGERFTIEALPIPTSVPSCPPAPAEAVG